MNCLCRLSDPGGDFASLRVPISAVPQSLRLLWRNKSGVTSFPGGNGGGIYSHGRLHFPQVKTFNVSQSIDENTNGTGSWTSRTRSIQVNTGYTT